MGSFEDAIRKKFEDKEQKAPPSVWDHIANSLNADFFQTHQVKQSQNSRYKWIAAAVFLITFVSFALRYNPRYEQSSDFNAETSGTFYNALLSGNTGLYSTENPIAHHAPFPDFRTYPVEKKSGTIAGNEHFITDLIREDLITSNTTNYLSSLNPEIKEASVHSNIYPYHQGGAYYTPLSLARNSNGEKLWAGLEAGAGNFSSSVGSSNVFSGSINQASLASAIGSDGFVNPSTQVNPDLDNGLATSVGVDLGMRLGNRWTFETGLAYTNVESSGDATVNVLDIYTVENSDFFGSQSDTDLPIIAPSSRETAIEVQDSYDYDVDLTSNVRFTSVPVKAGYFLVDRKMSLRLNVGVAANYFMGSQVRADNDVIDGSINDSFNIWSFDGLGGVEVGYSIFDRFDLTFEPNYRQSITPLAADMNTTTSRFLVQTGLRYKIQ